MPRGTKRKADTAVPAKAAGESKKSEAQASDKEVLPKGYALDPNGNLHSEIAIEACRFIHRERNHRNPGHHGMYIHNDYPSYGQLEAVENSVAEFATKLRAGKLIEAFCHLEGITLYLDLDCDIEGIDDADRFDHFVHMFGAAWVTVVKRLLSESQLNEEKLPYFKQVLQMAIELGNKLNGIADETCQFPEALQMALDGEDPNDLKSAWYDEEGDNEGYSLEDDISIDFDFEKRLAQYSDDYCDGQLGGSERDLRKMSKKEKKKYLLDCYKK